MREINMLAAYPQPSEPRKVGARTIQNRITASYRGKSFYDGDRADGYGGYVNDGRWGAVADAMIKEYAPKAVLQIGCDKGFLLDEFRKRSVRTYGTEISEYAFYETRLPVRPSIKVGKRWTPIPFDRKFDLVLALGPVYTCNLPDAIELLAEISRVGRRSFITLGAYDDEAGYWLLRDWSLLGTTILRKDEWREVMEHAGYDGDYWFNTAQSLRLERTWT